MHSYQAKQGDATVVSYTQFVNGMTLCDNIIMTPSSVPDEAPAPE